MKKLLFTCFIAVVASFSVNAQTAKAKRQAAIAAHQTGKNIADKKAKDDAEQARKMEIDQQLKKQKVGAVLPSPDNTAK